MSKTLNQLFCVDFNRLEQYTATYPVKCVIGSAIIYATTWTSMYVSICEYLLNVKNRTVSSIRLKKHKIKSKISIPLFIDEPFITLACHKMSNGKYLNINYSTKKMYSLLAGCAMLAELKKKQ